MYDIIFCEAEKNYGFTKLISFSEIKNKIVEIEKDEEILNRQNYSGIFLLKNFKISSEMIKIIGEKGKALFAINYFEIINSKGARRGIILSQIREFFKFCIKYNAKYCFVSLAKTEEGIRSPKEIVGIGSLVGLSEVQTRMSLGQLKKYL
ncbi:MAG: hypothetical protein PHU63_03485 [Candidatus ainarchaeum sp.]|nr:hypothetical protein [Candidatus ainarchaeum sp.]